MENKPNVCLVFADQWRAQACGYAGDINVKTPNLDVLATESINCVNAYSGCPVCSPYRASLLTGQRPLEHGVFLNDVRLGTNAVSIAQAFSSGGYDTAYIGKWHLDGHGRSNYIAPEFRQGFDYWKVLECTHTYNNSSYYAGDSYEKLLWEGYDAYAQTRDAMQYITSRKNAKPFMMVLSWGPPHNPYETAPDKFKDMYKADNIILRDNVPQGQAQQAREDLAGYYAHCSALDECLGMLLEAVEQAGIANNTVFVFTSDHGDMLCSQGTFRKQRPYAESVRVPFLLRYPAMFGCKGSTNSGFIGAEDIMPTLLELASLDIPDTVSGSSFVPDFNGRAVKPHDSGYVACYHPFGEYERRNGGREYRGLITGRYTYVRFIDGTRLLFDDVLDPFQMNNLAGKPDMFSTLEKLEKQLSKKLEKAGDRFEPGMAYIEKWGYAVNEHGTVSFVW